MKAERRCGVRPSPGAAACEHADAPDFITPPSLSHTAAPGTGAPRHGILSLSLAGYPSTAFGRAVAGGLGYVPRMLIMNYLEACWPQWRPAQARLLGAPILLLAVLAAGCSHSPKYGDRAGAFEAVPAPLPPLFLNGPMALLLTNLDGFRAHVVLESGAPPQTAQMAAGELMVRGGKLLFAPAPGGAAKKQARGGTRLSFGT